jgi:hypothetical protein
LLRADAIQLLREISSHPEVIPFTCVYLKLQSQANDKMENLELHLKTNRDPSTRKIIERLALKYQLIVKVEPDGFLGICTPERKLMKITA